MVLLLCLPGLNYLLWQKSFVLETMLKRHIWQTSSFEMAAAFLLLDTQTHRNTFSLNEPEFLRKLKVRQVEKWHKSSVVTCDVVNVLTHVTERTSASLAIIKLFWNVPLIAWELEQWGHEINGSHFNVLDSKSCFCLFVFTIIRRHAVNTNSKHSQLVIFGVHGLFSMEY